MNNITIKVDDWVGIIANIATTGSLIAIGYQAYIANKQSKDTNQQTKIAQEQLQLAQNTYKIANEREEKEKAIELAEIYCKDILPAMGYINEIFESIGIRKMLNKKIPVDYMKEFDKVELNGIIDSKTQKDIMNHIQKITPTHIYNARSKSGLINLDEYIHEQVRKTLTQIIQRKKEETDDSSDNSVEAAVEEMCATSTFKQEDVKYQVALLRYYTDLQVGDFNRVLNELLNKLEYFCMYFNTGVADDEVVYQSLHQSFLSTVQLMYFFIADKNEYSRDKYYINIIILYNKWAQMQMDKKREEEEIEEKARRGAEVKPKKIKR